VIVECVQTEAQIAFFDDFVIDGSSEERRITAVFEVQVAIVSEGVSASVLPSPLRRPGVLSSLRRLEFLTLSAHAGVAEKRLRFLRPSGGISCLSAFRWLITVEP